MTLLKIIDATILCQLTPASMHLEVNSMLKLHTASSQKGSGPFSLSQKGECTSILVIDTAKVKIEYIGNISKSEEIIGSTSENKVQQN